jgi:pyridoxal phosphate enzyme (YggS family)
LQANKVKSLVPFVDTIQSIDSVKLLETVDREAGRCNRKIKVLLQVHIAQEAHKFGFSFDEIDDFFKNALPGLFGNLIFSGLMGMATFTDNPTQIRKEFSGLNTFFKQIKTTYFANENVFNELSMGMSDDYALAVDEGSTMVRIGSKIFGTR